jgi:eukaryotic-like serine/threonine-protein kinase
MKKAGTALGTGSHVRADSGTQLKLGKLVKSGGAGSVYLLPAKPEQVAKIYHAGIDLALYERKIQAMLRLNPDLPELTDGGARITQVAWPQALLRDDGRRFRGFTMPRLHLDDTIELEYILQERQARAAGLPGGLGVRVTLAANVSALVAELHRQQHYVVDLKPVNIRFNRQSLHLAILDCDGFSIHGETERFPAPQYTPDYLAPEFHHHGLQVGGEEAQDRFALAVIVFQLLNFGIHPFTGRPVGNNVPTDIPARIAGRYYAYGQRAHKGMQPNPASGHEELPQELRHLFDRAFGNTDQPRPAANEWARVLAPYALKSTGRLVVCARNKEHQYFADKKCAACARKALMARAAKASKAAPAAVKAPPHARHQSTVPPQAQAASASANINWWDWTLMTLVLVVAGVFRLPALLLRALDRLDSWLTNNSPKWRGVVLVTVLVGSIGFLFVLIFRSLLEQGVTPEHPAPQAQAAPVPPAVPVSGSPDPRGFRLHADIDALLDTAHKGDGIEFRQQLAAFMERPRSSGREDFRTAWNALQEYRTALRQRPQPSDATGNSDKDQGKQLLEFMEGLDRYLEKAETAAPYNARILSEVGFARLMDFGNLSNQLPYERVRGGWEATRKTYYQAIAAEPDGYSHWFGLGMVCAAMEGEASCAESAFAIGNYLRGEAQAAKAAQQGETGGIDGKEFGYSRLRFVELFFIEERKTRLNKSKERGIALAKKLEETSSPPASQKIKG